MNQFGNGHSRNGAQRGYPWGPVGVGATLALLGALVALAIPMGWIEELSWQLYLDRLMAAARPPLGATARLAMILVAAGVLGLLGWAAAVLLRVRADNRLIDSLRARFGGGAPLDEDEEDAPRLRRFDRHPDAPARRPFSAARDIATDDDFEDDLGDAAADHAPLGWSASDDEEEDELLLGPAFSEEQVPVETMALDEVRAERWEALETVDPHDAEWADVVADEAAPMADPAGKLVDIPAGPPTAGLAIDTDEGATEGATAPVEPVIAAAAVRSQAAEPVAALDLSIARLDELIARLEAGLARRETLAAEAAPAAEMDAPRLARGMQPSPVNDAQDQLPPAAVPHDPALAAALATLRRMNRNAG